MPYAACLLDVYETVLTVRSEGALDVFADLTGIAGERLAAAVGPWQAPLQDGRATIRGALEAALRECGVSPEPDLLDRLVAEDRRLLRDGAEVWPDVAPFLEDLRAAGVATALVSNCADNTRQMLASTGLVALVDEVVLSCEVGAAKPDAATYRAALDALGAEPGDALFVDDQQAFCDGATALGIRAVRIDRARGGGDVSTLEEVRDRFRAPGAAPGHQG